MIPSSVHESHRGGVQLAASQPTAHSSAMSAPPSSSLGGIPYATKYRCHKFSAHAEVHVLQGIQTSILPMSNKHEAAAHIHTSKRLPRRTKKPLIYYFHPPTNTHAFIEITSKHKGMHKIVKERWLDPHELRLRLPSPPSDSMDLERAARLVSDQPCECSAASLLPQLRRRWIACHGSKPARSFPGQTLIGAAGIENGTAPVPKNTANDNQNQVSGAMSPSTTHDSILSTDITQQTALQETVQATTPIEDYRLSINPACALTQLEAPEPFLPTFCSDADVFPEPDDGMSLWELLDVSSTSVPLPDANAGLFASSNSAPQSQTLTADSSQVALSEPTHHPDLPNHNGWNP